MGENAHDYKMYRGKCREMSEELVRNDSTLRLVRGFYYCPVWGKQVHWWCETPDGTIVDPSVKQFPTDGIGAIYEEFDGYLNCSNCNKRIHETEMILAGNGNYYMCSNECYADFIGM